MLAHADAQVQLHPAVLQVHIQRHQGVPLPLHLRAQLADLAFMQQQPFGTQRIGVEDIALLIGADVHSLNEHFAVFHNGVAFLQVHPALAHGLDFRALQFDAALDAFLHEEIVACLPVLGNGLDADLLRHGHTSSLLAEHDYTTHQTELQCASFPCIIGARRDFAMHVEELSAQARQAAYQLSALPLVLRNAALAAIQDGLKSHAPEIFAQNQLDLADAEAQNLAAPLLKRLKFDEKKMAEVLSGIDSLIRLPDPLGKVSLARELTPGLDLYRVSCPIGVIGVIFESRPDALVQIASLCVKSGNASLLKGGREALRTNRALMDAMLGACRDILPAGWAALLETREDVNDMLTQDEHIDLIIPRGSNAFVRYIMDHTRIPVMGHAEGLCHTYVDAAADIPMAVKVVTDAKTQALAVCNATETLLVHRDIAAAFLPPCAEKLKEKGVELRGDEAVQALIPCLPATEADWAAEYLDAILSIKIVDSVEEAITHINRYGSHHTDAILTMDEGAKQKFLAGVDSAGVYVNCSTRFADGYRYGFGAEVGIATGKLHARGPVGVEGLCTYKYQLIGSGQTVEETVNGTLRYTHRNLI